MTADGDHDPRTSADVGRGPPAQSADATAGIGVPAFPEPTTLGSPPASPPSEGMEEEHSSAWFDPLPARGRRWRWYHVAPGFVPLVLLLLALVAGAPQRILGRLHGADPLEENDTIGQAHPIEPDTLYADLTCRHGDVDWFRLAIPAGKALKVVATPVADSEGSLSVHTLEGAVLVEGHETVTHTPSGLAAVEVAIRVWGGRMGTYKLEAKLVDPRTRLEPNDRRRDAAAVEPGKIEALRCDGRDWFSVEVPRFRSITARVIGAGLGVHVADGLNDTARDLKGTLPDNATLGAYTLPRRVYVEVVGRGDYDLELSLGPIDQNLVAKTGLAKLPIVRTRLEPNQTPDSALQVKPGHYPDLRVDLADFYRVDVPANTTLQVDLKPRRSWATVKLQDVRHSPPGAGFGLRHETEAGGSHLLFHQDKAATVWFGLEGSLRYAMKVRLTPGPPGVLVPPGEYPKIQGQGDDLWRIDLLPGQTVVTDVVTWNEDHYGMNLVMSIQGQAQQLQRPGGMKIKPRRRGRRRPGFRRQPMRPQERRPLRATVRGQATLRYTARIKESIVLRVVGPPQPYELTVRMEGTGTSGFQPKRVQHVSAGTFRDRVIKGDAEAYYRVALKRDQVFVAAITFTNSLADLDLELLDAAGMRLTQSATSEANQEQVRFVSQHDQVAYLKVNSTGDQRSKYDLIVSRDGSTRPTTKPLQLGKRAGIRCSGSDHYRISLKAGQRIQVRTVFKHSEGDLDLALLRPDGVEIRRSSTANDQEVVQFTSQLGGEVLVRIQGATSTYDLIAIVDTP